VVQTAVVPSLAQIPEGSCFAGRMPVSRLEKCSGVSGVLSIYRGRAATHYRKLILIHLNTGGLKFFFATA
jgi:hypothetical protein